jgi:hypothetical protein
VSKTRCGGAHGSRFTARLDSPGIARRVFAPAAPVFGLKGRNNKPPALPKDAQQAPGIAGGWLF